MVLTCSADAMGGDASASAAVVSASADAPKPSLLPAPYEMGLTMDNGDTLPYDLSKVLALHHQRSARATTLNIPPGIDPVAAMHERENRISTKMAARIEHLVTRPAHIPYDYRVTSNIELRSLRLANFQAQIRSEVMHALKTETTLVTAVHPHAYRRIKRQSLREARVTEKLEKHRKIEAERRKRQDHAEMLNAIMQHAKVFKEFHRNKALSIMKTRRAVATWHQNSDRERKKEEERKERERMQRLQEDDEEAYRQLLDEKKDKRLVHLLEQTDEFIRSLTGLVKSHQQAEKKKKREERKAREAAAGIEQPAEGEEGATKADEDSDDEDEGLAVNDDDAFEGLTEEEKAKKILEKARNEEDEYDPKTRRQIDDYFSIAHRIKEKIVKQHSTMGGGNPELQLKQYQLRGLEWMVSLYNNNLNGILADEMGLGKTIQTISLVTYLMEVKQNMGPYLVIVPLSTMSNWKMEFEKWAPNVRKIVYKGDKEQRRALDREVRRGDFNVLLTTYEYVQREKALLGKIHYKYMIIDEGHRLKNDKGQLTLILNSHFRAQHRLLLTGTPLQNKLPELWALLNFLLPTIFSSCGTFDAWFNAPFEATGEKAVLSNEETMLIIRRLHKVLRPFLLRRLKKEVEAQLPDKSEHVIKCEMSALQRVLYKHMQKGLLIDGKQQAGGKALANTVMHLRKLCNHPFLFPSVEESCKRAWELDDYVGDEIYRVAGKFELLDKILPKLHATGHRILIFSQMVEAMHILADYFEFRQWKYLRLDGSTNHEERGELLRQYNAPNSEYWLFMLSTRAGGLGLNLQTADTVIIFDSDWNPAQDMQAMDRAHRIGQKREVRVLRLITANSVEEKILAAARHKLNIDEKVIQAGKFDQKSTGDERRKMLELIIKAEEDDKAADDIPDDEMINQLIARSEEEFDKFQSMDLERRRSEALQLHRKPRLVEENEIPEDITKASEAAVQRQAEFEARGGAKEEVVGRRKRKTVDYSIDSMTDEAFLREIGEIDDNEEEETPKRKKSKRSRDEEDDDSGTPTKKRNGFYLADDDDE